MRKIILIAGVLLCGLTAAQGQIRLSQLEKAPDSTLHIAITVPSGTVNHVGQTVPVHGQQIYARLDTIVCLDSLFTEADSICMRFCKTDSIFCLDIGDLISGEIEDSDTRVDSCQIRNDTLWCYIYDVIGATLLDSIYAEPIGGDGGSAAIAYLNTLDELEAYSGAEGTAFVRDSLRGGFFELRNSGVVDSAWIFPHNNGTHYWHRLLLDGTVWLTWYERADSSWSEVLQRAIDTVSANSMLHTVYLPDRDSTYWVDTLGAYLGGGSHLYCAELKSNVRILADPEVWVLLSNDMITPTDDSTKRVNMFYGDSVQHVTIQGGTWSGNYQGQYQEVAGYFGQSGSGNVFRFIGSTDTLSNAHITFKDVTTRDHSGSAVYIGLATHVVAENVAGFNHGEGWWFGNESNDILVDGYRYADTAGVIAGDAFEMSSARNARINDVFIDSCLSGQAMDFYLSRNITVSNFILHNARGLNAEGNGVDSIVNIVISNGVIRNTWVGIGMGEDMIVSDVKIRNCNTAVNIGKSHGERVGSTTWGQLTNVHIDSCQAAIVLTDSCYLAAFDMIISNSGNRALRANGTGDGTPAFDWFSGASINNGEFFRIDSNGVSPFEPRIRIFPAVYVDPSDNLFVGDDNLSNVEYFFMYDTLVKTGMDIQFDTLHAPNTDYFPLLVDDDGITRSGYWSLVADSLVNSAGWPIAGTNGIFALANNNSLIGENNNFTARVGSGTSFNLELIHPTSIFEVTDDDDSGSIQWTQGSALGIRQRFYDAGGAVSMRVEEVDANEFKLEADDSRALHLIGDAAGIVSESDHQFEADVIDVDGDDNPLGYIPVGQGDGNGFQWVDTTGLFPKGPNGIFSIVNDGSIIGQSSNFTADIGPSDTFYIQPLNASSILEIQDPDDDGALRFRQTAANGIRLEWFGADGNEDFEIGYTGTEMVLRSAAQLDIEAQSDHISSISDHQFEADIIDVDGDDNPAGYILVGQGDGNGAQWVDTTGLFAGGGGGAADGDGILTNANRDTVRLDTITYTGPSLHYSTIDNYHRFYQNNSGQHGLIIQNSTTGSNASDGTFFGIGSDETTIIANNEGSSSVRLFSLGVGYVFTAHGATGNIDLDDYDTGHTGAYTHLLGMNEGSPTLIRIDTTGLFGGGGGAADGNGHWDSGNNLTQSSVTGWILPNAGLTIFGQTGQTQTLTLSGGSSYCDLSLQAGLIDNNASAGDSLSVLTAGQGGGVEWVNGYDFAKRSSTSTQTINGTLAAIPWQTEERGTPNITWDSGNNTRITVEADGIYRIGGYFTYYESADSRVQCIVEIRINGTPVSDYRASGYVRNTTESWDYWVLEMAAEPYDLSADDYVEIFIAEVSGGSYTTTTNGSPTLAGEQSRVWVERMR